MWPALALAEGFYILCWRSHLIECWGNLSWEYHWQWLLLLPKGKRIANKGLSCDRHYGSRRLLHLESLVVCYPHHKKGLNPETRVRGGTKGCEISFLVIYVCRCRYHLWWIQLCTFWISFCTYIRSLEMWKHFCKAGQGHWDFVLPLNSVTILVYNHNMTILS